MNTSITKRLVLIIPITIFYFLFGKFGLSFALINPSASPIWPSSGFSIAALILFGLELWPAIFLGAFLVNLTTTGSILTSSQIALGNTLEAWVGAYYVNRFARGVEAFDRVEDIFKFTILAGFLATAISATIGSSALLSAGFSTPEQFAWVWLTWWLGDVGGVLLITPLLTLWGRDHHFKWNRQQVFEALILVVVLVITGGIVFGPWLFSPYKHFPLDFIGLSVLLWVAFRFGKRETALFSFLLSIFAIIGTLRGFGPFAVVSPNESLLLLQSYLGVSTLLSLAVAATVSMNKQNQFELANADRRKDEFLAMLSHELRNPLATISCGVQLATRNPTAEKVAWIHDTIKHEVKHLSRIIDDLLDISRFSRGKIQLRKDTHQLSEIISRSLQTCSYLFSEKKQILTTNFPSQPIWLEVDATRIVQIIINLLTNASKYSNQGDEIFLDVVPEGREVTIKVRDQGVGITEDLLPRVFELFTQADRSLDRSQGGLGIGLTLVKKLTEIHGGRVGVSSPGAGKGSEFWVTLPVCVAPISTVEDARSSNADTVAAKCNILLVDDNVFSATMLAKMLELNGHTVRLAKDGFEAVEFALNLLPDVVLLDIGLPGIDGYQVATKLRQVDKLNGALIVAISGYGQPEDHQRSKAAGFDYHLVKPIDFDQLKALINEFNMSELQ